MSTPGVIDRLSGWLTPARRKAIYAALVASGAVLTTLGTVSSSWVTGAVGIVDAALGVAALLLAARKAKRVEWKAAYAAFALLVAALKTAGVIGDGTASHWLDILAAAAAAGPLLAAMLRTDPATPTGEPLAEYVGRHAAPADPGPLNPTVSSEGVTYPSDTKADAADYDPKHDVD